MSVRIIYHFAGFFELENLSDFFNLLSREIKIQINFSLTTTLIIDDLPY